MRVLVDTPIWSECLRRSSSDRGNHRAELSHLIENGQVEIIGPIRQEVLSGVKEPKQFDRLSGMLGAFKDLPLDTELFVEAARYYNLCRSKGIQGSGTDFLICAVAAKYDLEIYTTDKDFEFYSAVLPIRIHRIKVG